jgi:phospholipid/cholesterol/gamma-HCH transport system permease protein
MQIGNINYDTHNNILKIDGNWTVLRISSKDIHKVENLLITNFANTVNNVDKKEIKLDMLNIADIDSVGAYFLSHFLKTITQKFKILEVKISNQNKKLLNQIDQELLALSKLEIVEKNDHVQKKIIDSVLGLLIAGSNLIYYNIMMFNRMIYACIRWKFLPFTTIVNNILSIGYTAIPLVILLSFLIGINLTYQLAPQFSSYGANIYVVNFLGIALFREVIPLLTAILVVARSGSAITATLGTMKLQEEIDALVVMGIDPNYRLIIPQLIAMIISLPILTALADIISMIGGAIVSYIELNISFPLFMSRLQQQVAISQYVIGIVKSFIFAWLIAVVSSFLGLQVQYGADNLGRSTTKSVVLSTVLIVFFDALLAVICSTMNL